MVIGIIIMKSVWIIDEIRLFKSRLNFTMLKTNVIEVGILALQILQVYYFPFPATEFDGLIMILGIVIYAIGMFFAFWGKYSMNRVWGIPGMHSAKQNKVVTSGAFALSRNPIYVGIILIFLGFSIAIRSWLIILRLPLFIYLYRSIKKEEKILEDEFGKDYIEYKSKTPRFLFGI